MYVAGEVVDRFGVDADTALANGIAARVKIQGRWLYRRADDADVEDTLDRLEAALDEVLAEWLLNPAQYLVGQTLQTPVMVDDVSHQACRLLIQELCHRQRLDGVALMSRSLQPYLAFHRTSDADEVRRQVASMRALLERYGSITWRYLPDPVRTVPRQAWRTTMLAHGAWLGLGHQPQRGVLQAW